MILVTSSNKQEAKRIAASLVGSKLAACVNIIDKISSLFFWQGKIDKASECLLLIKSKKEKLSKIIKQVQSLHSYEVPEIIAFPIVAGSKSYLRWIDASVR